MPAADRTDAPRPGTRHPHHARERALKILFQADLRGQDPRVLLHDLVADRAGVALLDDLDPDEPAAIALEGESALEPLRRPDAPPLDVYTRTLVEGVADHRASIDRTIERFAHRWSVPRMPVVDRNVLRLAVYELHHQDTPPAVVIDEALVLAGDFAATERSVPFINGVLESIRRELDQQDVGGLPGTAPSGDPSTEPGDVPGDGPGVGPGGDAPS
jgi:transcription antitermination protein NusB